MNSDMVLVIDSGELKEKGAFNKLQRFRDMSLEEDDEENMKKKRKNIN